MIFIPPHILVCTRLKVGRGLQYLAVSASDNNSVFSICRAVSALQISCCMMCVTQVNMKLVECFSYQLFHTGFVHADPHPGNSMCLKCCFVLFVLIRCSYGLSFWLCSMFCLCFIYCVLSVLA